MKKFFKPAFTALLFFTLFTASFALAEPKPSQKPTSKPKAVAPCLKDYLDCALDSANADLAAAKQDISKIAHSTEIDPCVAGALRVRREYDEWFINHHAELKELLNQTSPMIAATNKKIIEVKGKMVQLNPVSEQDQSGANVALGDVINYFIDLNQKISSCPKDKFQALMSLQQDPSFNRFGISHDQILAAMPIISKNMNASLKLTSSQYRIIFINKDNHFKLYLRSNSNAQSLYFDLLSLDDGIINEENQWVALSRRTLDDQPIDAVKRYLEIQNKFLDQACVDHNRLVTKAIASRPYLNIAQLQEIAAKGDNVNQDDDLTSDSVSIYQNLKQVGGRVTKVYLTDSNKIFGIVNSVNDFGGLFSWQNAWQSIPSVQNLSNLSFLASKNTFFGAGHGGAAISVTVPEIEIAHATAIVGNPKVKQVDVIDDGTLFALSADGLRFVKKNPTGLGWQNLSINSEPTRAFTSFLALNNGDIFALTAAGALYASKAHAPLMLVEGIEAKEIVKSSAQDHIYLLNQKGNVHKLNVWSNQLSIIYYSPKDRVLTTISVNKDEKICGVTADQFLTCIENN